MRSGLTLLRRLAPFFVSGVVITLFIAWGLPMALSARGSGAWGEPTLQWFGRPAKAPLDEKGIGIDIPSTVAMTPSLEVRRGILSDWYIAFRSEVGSTWPSGELTELSLEHALSEKTRRPSSSVVVSPPPGEEERFSRIDTALTGWPFRAFRGESWYLADDSALGHDVMPEFRGNWNLGMVDGQHLTVPHRALWLGIFANILFWTTFSWALVAFPVAVRRRRREKYGKCLKCGYAMDVHAVKRPDTCPECGTSFRRDPLGFAHSPEMHFQNLYVWIIFISSLDIMLTWKILSRGGMEVNPVAAAVIDLWGMQGAIAFKFALMMWVIVACEILARLKRNAGRFLAITAVAVSSLPVAWSLFLLVRHALTPE